ncbi:MAG: hypothetical protein ACREJD_09440 [Phycisphaerales bacterium]
MPNEEPTHLHDSQPAWAIRVELKVDALNDRVDAAVDRIDKVGTTIDGPTGHQHLGYTVRIDRLERVVAMLMWICGITFTAAAGAIVLILVRWFSSGALAGLGAK